REWDSFAATNVGKWRGIWTTYDDAGVQQGDPDRMDTNLELSSDGERIKHINTLFVGSIDSECSACFDSVETKKIPIGEYTKKTFRQRAYGSAYLNGPGVTPRGDMSIEMGFRDGDSRVRFMVFHRPPAEQLAGIEPPSQLALERIVVVKENFAQSGSGSTEGTSVADLLLPQLDEPSWLGLWRGSAGILESDSDSNPVDRRMIWREDTVSPTHLRNCLCSGATGADDHVSLNVGGRIRLEVPSVIRAGEPAEIVFGWARPLGGNSDAQKISRGKVRVEALTRVVDTEYVSDGSQRIKISPPQLIRFAVEDLEPVSSAGL
ncbi:unnamed protein product, partial [Sphacelaria rigidula]